VCREFIHFFEFAAQETDVATACPISWSFRVDLANITCRNACANIQDSSMSFSSHASFQTRKAIYPPTHIQCVPLFPSDGAYLVLLLALSEVLRGKCFQRFREQKRPAQRIEHANWIIMISYMRSHLGGLSYKYVALSRVGARHDKLVRRSPNVNGQPENRRNCSSSIGWRRW
jgi:hypothetical protein